MKKNGVVKLLLISVFAVSLISATSGGLGSLQNALSSLCHGIKSLIPIVSFLMIVAAGVVYAAGQMLGAETRARASVWATAMLIGAIIGILIVIITPTVLGALYGGANSYAC